MLGTGRKASVLGAAEFSDTVVCGLVAKRRCPGLEGGFLTTSTRGKP